MGLLTRQDRRTLIETLLRMPACARQEGRTQLLQDLPFNLVSNIERASSPLIDIANIVNTADTNNWAQLIDGTSSVALIIENALALGPDPQTAQQLEKLLAGLPQTGRQTDPASTGQGQGTRADPLSGGGLPPTTNEPAVSLDSKQLRRLHQAILSAFPDQGSLARMARFGMDARLEEVVTEANLPEKIFDLIMWAESQGRIADLIKAARSANPDNADLTKFAAEAGLITAKQHIPSVPSSPPPTPLNETDRDWLVRLLSILGLLQKQDSLKLFLKRAGIADTWINAYRWDGGPQDLATQLVFEAERQQYPLWGGRPGYTVLGMILDRLLREQAVGYEDGRHFARLIETYKLIDLNKATVSMELQNLRADK